MSKKSIAIIVVILCAFAGIIAISNTNMQTAPNYSRYDINTIYKMADNYSNKDLNPDSVIEASEDTGGLPEKVIGDPNTAKVIVYEYADYACAHCASWSSTLDKMVAESNGDLAVVYRGYLLGFKTDVVSASAATAAQIQGCWKEYKDLLFANQAEWTYLSGDELKEELVACFKRASNGQGDVEKFKEDMASEAVAKKIAFEHRLGKEIQLTGTPTFRIDGEAISVSDLEEKIKEKLSEA